MLVLSRTVGTEIVIGTNIVVRVHRISGNRVALAIEAPREVSVRRGELRDEPPRNDEAETRLTVLKVQAKPIEKVGAK